MLRSNKLYMNVHTAASPGGEIRGQIVDLHAKKKKKSEDMNAPAPAAAPK
jgi:hypothetical protein